ncbi:hypothetical protein GA0115252_14461, partial [Streptomyces sp. DfronAA-171]
RAALTLDLAGAYPARAGLRAWERTAALVRGEEPRVEIRDAWRLGAAPERLVLHLLLGGEVTAAGAGRALVRPPRGRGLALAWDDDAFAAEVETVVLEDPAFSRMWGEAVRRLVLTARAPGAEGTHVLTARPAD